MSTGWMSLCAVAVDTLARALRAPLFARTIEALAAVSLVILAAADTPIAQTIIEDPALLQRAQRPAGS
jgi:hypothetical protein